jgi:predicted RNA-binding protein
MKQKAAVRLLSNGDSRTFEKISDLINEDPLFAEILEEYILATDVLEKWSQEDGISSLRIRQYQDLVKERELEMREILQHRLFQ